jgi:hypothetical protein
MRHAPDYKMRGGYKSCGISHRPWAARTALSTVRTDSTPRVRFSAMLSEEPEIEVALV